MPLLIVAGPPCAGKTTRSAAVAEALRTRTPSAAVHVINEESLALNKQQIYADAANEKKARGAILAAVERSLSKDCTVIVDSCNYIKGFRYQLYCVARAIGTPHCVMYCACDRETAVKRNSAAYGAGVEGATLIGQLFDRFEEPSAFARWDTPLLRVNVHDDSPPVAAIETALFGVVPPPPNLSTVVKSSTECTYLAQLDACTQRIVQTLVLWLQRGNIMGNCAHNGRTLHVGRCTGASELRRLQKQFVSMNKLHQLAAESVEAAFVDYLNKQLQ